MTSASISRRLSTDYSIDVWVDLPVLPPIGQFLSPVVDNQGAPSLGPRPRLPVVPVSTDIADGDQHLLARHYRHVCNEGHRRRTARPKVRH